MENFGKYEGEEAFGEDDTTKKRHATSPSMSEEKAGAVGPEKEKAIEVAAETGKYDGEEGFGEDDITKKRPKTSPESEEKAEEVGPEMEKAIEVALYAVLVNLARLQHLGKDFSQDFIIQNMIREATSKFYKLTERVKYLEILKECKDIREKRDDNSDDSFDD